MDIRYLRHFLAVAEELHFGRAARRLGMEQAPLSQSIKRLEAHLGVRLFERSARSGTRLTEAGRRLRPEAERALLQFQAAMDSARQVAQPAPVTLRVGFVTLGLMGPLPGAIRAMEQARPDVSVRLEEGATADLLERVAEGRLDLALFHPVERRPPGVAVRPVRRDRIIAALPSSHRLAGRGKVSLRDLADDPLILFPSASGADLRRGILQAYRDFGLTPRIEQEARSTPTMLLLVAAGLGYALVAESARYLPFSNVAFVALSDLPDTLDWGLWLGWREGALSEAARDFAGRLDTGARAPGPGAA